MRRAFLALLGGAAWGQAPGTNSSMMREKSGFTGTLVQLPPGTKGESSTAIGIHTPPKRKPLNGECPVCGTMAPKRTDSYLIADGGGAIAISIECPTGSTCEYRKDIRVACSHCRAVFEMDAEAAK